MSGENVEQYNVYVYLNYLEHGCREIDQEIEPWEDCDDILWNEIDYYFDYLNKDNDEEYIHRHYRCEGFDSEEDEEKYEEFVKKYIAKFDMKFEFVFVPCRSICRDIPDHNFVATVKPEILNNLEDHWFKFISKNEESGVAIYTCDTDIINFCTSYIEDNKI